MDKTALTILLIYLSTIAVMLTVSGAFMLVNHMYEEQIETTIAKYVYTPAYVDIGSLSNIADVWSPEFEFLDATNTTDPKHCPNKPTKLRKRKLVVFLLAFFVGQYGVDRFYTGYIAQG
jgi:hypothetical protein